MYLPPVACTAAQNPPPACMYSCTAVCPLPSCQCNGALPLQEYKIHNADILMKEDCTVDDLIDVIEVSLWALLLPAGKVLGHNAADIGNALRETD